MLVLALLLWHLHATQFQSLSQRTLQLPRLYQSAGSLGNYTLFTWTDDSDIWICVTVGSECPGKRLGPGYRSYVFSNEHIGAFEVLTATNEDVRVAQVSVEGRVVYTQTFAGTKAKDLTGVGLPNSLVVLSWSSYSPSTGYDIYACLLDSTGTLHTPPFLINSYVQGDQVHPFLSIQGNFLQIVWESTGYHKGIFTQFLGFDGSKSGNEACVSLYGHCPMLFPEGIVLLNRVGLSPQLEYQLISASNPLISLWKLVTLQENFEFQAISQNSDLYLLYSGVDLEGLGSVKIRKSSPEVGCILSEYQVQGTPADSYIHGRILWIASDTLTLVYYDIRAEMHVIEVLTNPRNSICEFEAETVYPEWKSPHIPQISPWKKPLIVTGACVAFLVGLVVVILLLRRIFRKRQKPPMDGDGNENVEMQPSQGKDDSSLVLFDVLTPSSPDKPNSA